MTEENSKPKVYAWYFKNLGRYNLCSTENDWHVSLRTSGGNFSETWPEDEEPDIGDLLPSEVLDLTEERLKSYWISAKRDETLARIEEWRKHADEYDLAWLSKQREETFSKLEEIDNKIARYTKGEENV